MKRVALRKSLRLECTISEDNTVRGYASVFDVLDAEGDIVRKGAYAEAVAAVEDGAVLPVLWQHRSDLIPVGKILELEEDGKGLRFVAAINDTLMGTDLSKAIADQSVSQVSVGGWIDKAQPGEEGRELLEIDLDEISMCIWGANGETSVHKQLGLYGAADILQEIAYLRGELKLLSSLVQNPTSYGPPAQDDQLEAAVMAEVQALADWSAEQFHALSNGDENGD